MLGLIKQDIPLTLKEQVEGEKISSDSIQQVMHFVRYKRGNDFYSFTCCGRIAVLIGIQGDDPATEEGRIDPAAGRVWTGNGRLQFQESSFAEVRGRLPALAFKNKTHKGVNYCSTPSDVQCCAKVLSHPSFLYSFLGECEISTEIYGNVQTHIEKGAKTTLMTTFY